MATFKPCVQKQRVRWVLASVHKIVHKSKPGYIKTDKIVSPKGIAKSGDIIAPVVNEYCAKAILRYSDMLNRVDSHKVVCVTLSIISPVKLTRCLLLLLSDKTLLAGMKNYGCHLLQE